MVDITDKRYLLIPATGYGFWQEMHNVLSRILEAELTGRIPVVYWGDESLYGTGNGKNAFTRFFFPVSDYTEENIDGEDVAVCRTYSEIDETMKLIGPDNPLYGLDSHTLYRIMLKKYIRLRPDILRAIDIYYKENMEGKKVAGVHIRGSDKITEVPGLRELNERYPKEINGFLAANPGAKIFLMTDCADILSRYKKAYGGKLIYTGCKRVAGYGEGVHYKKYRDKKDKRYEIIRDTWLAARCDYFIGNGYSNVSRAVTELKEWPEENVRLLY